MIDKTNEKEFEKIKRYNLLKIIHGIFISKLWLALMFMIVLGLFLIFFSFNSTSQIQEIKIFIIREIGKGFLIAAVITIFLKIVIERQYREIENEFVQYIKDDISATLSNLKKEINENLQNLFHASASLEAMSQSGIFRIYPSRRIASEDIATDLIAPNTSKIRLIAISLNDFVRGDQPVLNRAWQEIEQYIRGHKELPKKTKSLDIKILIIDPECFGAQLRSRGECRDQCPPPGRLRTDVFETVKYLLELIKICEKNHSDSKISISFRLYRLPPLLFLCQTDDVSYVHQYHFWASRNSDVPIPVFRYTDIPQGRISKSLHREMTDHFDWIWSEASIDPDEFLRAKSVGIDKGIYQSGAVNVFNDPKIARQRIIWHINHAKKKLYIQGISLNSFFNIKEPDIFAPIKRLLMNNKIEIKILLLNPDSEQAKIRSYREHLFADTNISFYEYKANPRLHINSKLFRETVETITTIKDAIMNINKGNFTAKLYDTSPACFTLIVDDFVLVEQYHFGKTIPDNFSSEEPIILGKDMPLFEYSIPGCLYESTPARTPLILLNNHFDFVFNECSSELT